MKTRKFTILLIIVMLLASCNKHEGFKKHSSGYYYKFYIENNSKPRPEVGDFVEINMSLRTDNTVITPMTKNSLTIEDRIYRGDIYTALKNMHLGDSATFIFKGRKFYERFLNMGDYPYGKEPIYADIKLSKVMSKKKIEMAEENYKEYNKRMKHVEDSIMADYAVYHHIDVKKNGIYRIFNKKGGGKEPKKGQMVHIIYKSYLLDGTVIGEQTDRNKPCIFELGKGQVAQGVEIMVSQMRVGDAVTCVMPSRHVYGEAGNEELNIPPYTPVVFDIELLKIVK